MWKMRDAVRWAIDIIARDPPEGILQFNTSALAKFHAV